MSKKILVIDDERSVRDAFELTLRDAGYDVCTAPSGQVGLDLFDTEEPELVFLDLKMPEMDGVSVLREIRKRDTSVDIYIVTAFQREFLEQLSEAAKDGLEFELASKPMKHDQIISIVKSMIGGAA